MRITRRNLLASGLILPAALTPARAFAAAPDMTIYKDPNCGCCHLWSKAMAEAGYTVKLVDLDDLAPIKARFGIPDDLQGCHTAEIGGYFLEGHVPLASVRRLLAEKPAIAGLAVAGMPSGSLGMGDDPNARYDVMAVPKEKGGKPVLYEAVGARG
jgi:hypothetical protein